MARCIQELERIKGVRQGSSNKKGDNRIGKLNNSTRQNQSDIANELNIDRTQLLNYKKLTKLIPELQDLIESNQMKATVGYKIWAKMPQEEQVYSREICKNNRTSYKSLVGFYIMQIPILIIQM